MISTLSLKRSSIRSKRLREEKGGTHPAMHTIDSISRGFKVYINPDIREAFWKTLIAQGQREQEKHGQRNPFDTIHMSNLVVDILLSYGDRTQAQQPTREEPSHGTILTEDALTDLIPPSETPFDTNREAFWLYIHRDRREAFWDHLLTLGRQVMEQRGGRKTPFESVSVSALICAKVLKLAGIIVPTEKLITSRSHMNQKGRMLTIAIADPEKSQQFWHALTELAKRVRVTYTRQSPFRGINMSALLFDIMIASAEAIERHIPIEETSLADKIDMSSASIGEEENPASTDHVAEKRKLVLYTNQKIRTQVWESLITLGAREMSNRTDDNPFDSPSISMLVADTIINLWKRIERTVQGNQSSPIDDKKKTV